jgi:hypothetical protein
MQIMFSETNELAGRITAILMLTLLVGILLVTGCGDGAFPQTDIIVYKTSSNGTVEWSADLDTGMQDSIGSVIETSDGGYLVAGGISEYHKGHINPVFPRLVKLDKSGNIQWDTILNSTSDNANFTGAGWATTVLEKSDGDFLAGLYNGWVLTISPKGTVKNITALDNGRLSAITTDDGGILFVGNKTMKFDAYGNLTWKMPLGGSTKAFQTSDGRYLFDTTLIQGNDTIQRVSCLAPNGSTLWTYDLGSWPKETTTSFYESSPGVTDFTYSFITFEEMNGMTYSVMTKKLTFDRQGQVITDRNLNATGVLARTSDDGYVFVGNPFPDSGKYTTDYSKNTILHIVKLSADGSTIWDRPLTPAGYNYPRLIIPARDGGYVALVGMDVFHGT